MVDSPAAEVGFRSSVGQQSYSVHFLNARIHVWYVISQEVLGGVIRGSI